MISWADVVEAARKEIGTPFHHQGRTPGVGIDCSGLVVVTMKALGIEPAHDPVGYSRHPSRFDFLDHCRQTLIPLEIVDATSGDVLAFWISESKTGKRPPQHLSIVTDPSSRMVHAYSEPGKTVEHEIDHYWRQRVIAAFRIPGVAPCPHPGPFIREVAKWLQE